MKHHHRVHREKAEIVHGPSHTLGMTRHKL